MMSYEIYNHQTLFHHFMQVSEMIMKYSETVTALDQFNELTNIILLGSALLSDYGKCLSFSLIIFG